MNRAIVLLLVVGLVWPAALDAQGSQFGVRGLGLPGLPISTRAGGTAGASGLFDAESALNPAAPVAIFRPTASFNLAQHWRTSENIFGAASGKDTNFPLFFTAGPIGERMVGTVSASVYTDRTFALTLTDTVLLRDEPVTTYDTVRSRGGLTDVRAALAFQASRRVAVGLGLHLITGTNRVDTRRSFADSSYNAVALQNELSYAGAGVSAGFTANPGGALHLAGMVRFDTDLSIDRDTVSLGDVPLPVTLAAGLRWTPSRRLSLSSQAMSRRWGRLDQALRDRGGAGAVHTTLVAAGLEWGRNAQRPDQLPLRLGVRWNQMPFPVAEGLETGTEFTAALGTGLLLGGGRASLDLSLERVWRSETVAFEERGVALRLGVAVRP